MTSHPRRLLETSLGEVWLAAATRPFRLDSPFDGEDFALLLVVAATDVTPAEQAELASALVARGCRYAVCAGHDASSWDDAIDWAFLETDADYAPPDERFVMTSWHTDQPLADVAWFFLWNTAFDDFEPSRFLALVVGGRDGDRELVAAALREAEREGFA